MADKLPTLRDSREAHSIANRTTGRLPRGVVTLVARMFTMLGSPHNSDVGPTCNDAGANARKATFGLRNVTNGYGRDDATGREDLGAATFYLLLGTNQAETHPATFATCSGSAARQPRRWSWSILAVPRPRAEKAGPAVLQTAPIPTISVRKGMLTQ